MVTYINKVTSWEHPYMEYRGLSTDTKPTDAPVNAKFVELDTGVEYYFSEGTWNIAPSPSGDGSGSGGAEKFIVTLTADDSGAETVWTADKTLAEIVEAAEANQVVVASYPDDMLGNLEIPLLTAIDQDETLGAIFCATFTPNQPVISLVIVGIVDGSSDEWNVFQKEIAEVPSYSSSNNGQVLGVDDGDLAWVNPSSGTEKFVVTLTQDAQTEEWTAADGVTIADIVAAKEEGNIVVCSIDLGYGYPFELPCVLGDSFGEGVETVFIAMFSGIGYGDDPTNIIILADTTSGSDEWVVQTTPNGECVPHYSSTNNGQVLSVSSGSLAWVTPSSGAEKFVVPITDNAGVTTNITFAQIKAAYDAGKDVEASIYIGIFNTTIKAALSFVNADTAEFVGCVYSPLDTKTRIYSCYCYTGGGSDTWNSHTVVVEDFPTYSSSQNGKVLGVSSGSLTWVTPESGITSWNDLEDKPFYEETVSVAINYTNPYIDGTNADKVVNASYLNTPVPISLYRVGDALTAAQLDGATMNLISDNGTEAQTGSITLTSADITSVQNGRYVMTEGLPLFVVADVDNTTIEIPNCCQFTSLDAGTYLEYIDMGNFLAGFYYCTLSITKDGVTAIHKLDEKFYDGGVSSWNDLNDRPFYETTTAAGYNFEIDLDDPNYVSGYFDIGSGTDVPAKFYRVGDPLTAAQLVGATGTVNLGGENNSKVIKSDYIEEITDNGDTVGLFVADDMPYALVIINANTTIDVDATNDRPFGVSGTFASAGTYLSWIDLSTLEEGAIAYNASLVKELEATVTPLPDKYYKAPLNVTADLDLTHMTVSNVSKSFDEIYAAITSGRVVSLTLQFNDGYNDIAVPMLPSQVASNDGNGSQIMFAVTAPFAFSGSTNVYTLRVSIGSTDVVSSNFYLHDATAQ